MDVKLTFIDFSRQVAEGSRSSWLQTLGNQLFNHSPYIRYTNSPYIRYTNCKYYCIILLEYINKSQVKVGVTIATHSSHVLCSQADCQENIENLSSKNRPNHLLSRPPLVPSDSLIYPSHSALLLFFFPCLTSPSIPARSRTRLPWRCGSWFPSAGSPSWAGRNCSCKSRDTEDTPIPARKGRGREVVYR